MTTYSLNEIESQCKKAARGAGMSWGIAEEAGKAARWLATQGIDGGALLAHWLEIMPVPRPRMLVLENGVWANTAGALCPVTGGTLIADRARDMASAPFHLANVAYPALLLFSVQASADWLSHAISVTWPGFTARLSPGGAPQISGDLRSSRASQVCCAVAQTATPAPHEPVWLPQRFTINDESWAILTLWAHKTYVPATAQSRLAGAGAGLADND